jgi:hypothetical protein
MLRALPVHSFSPAVLKHDVLSLSSSFLFFSSSSSFFPPPNSIQFNLLPSVYLVQAYHRFGNSPLQT